MVGIDPGTEKTAIVAWDGDSIFHHDIIENSNVVMTVESIATMREVSRVCCEMIASYGMPVGREVFETCLWIGEFRCEIRKFAKFDLVYRKDVKMHLCGSARAKDSNIRQALIDLYGKQGTKKEPGKLYGIRSHEWAALAVAEYGRLPTSAP